MCIFDLWLAVSAIPKLQDLDHMCLVTSLGKLFAMAVFLAGYPNGAKRTRDSKSTRSAVLLPEPAWFLDRVDTYTDRSWLCQKAMHKGSDIRFAEVVGLVQLGTGVVFEGNLTPFDLEANLLWRYWSRPHACYSVEVKEFFAIDEPIRIHARSCISQNVQGQNRNKDVNLQNWIFLPAAHLTTDALNLNEDLVDFDAIGDVSQIPVLWVPQVILELIKVGRWKSLLLHFSRGLNRRIGRDEGNLLQSLQRKMDWPSQYDFQRLWSVRDRFQESPTRPLTEDVASFLVNQICLHSSVLVSDGGRIMDHETLDQRHLMLEQAVEGLLVFSHSLEKTRNPNFPILQQTQSCLLIPFELAGICATVGICI